MARRLHLWAYERENLCIARLAQYSSPAPDMFIFEHQLFTRGKFG